MSEHAAAVAACLADPATAGRTYELGGPGVFSFRELMQLVLRETHRQRILLPLPWAMASLIGSVGDLLPIKPPLTSDQVELLRSDNVADVARPGLMALGVVPTAVEAIVPTYLHRYRRGGQFADEIAPAGVEA